MPEGENILPMRPRSARMRMYVKQTKLNIANAEYLINSNTAGQRRVYLHWCVVAIAHV
jgi:hypothetical protein